MNLVRYMCDGVIDAVVAVSRIFMSKFARRATCLQSYTGPSLHEDPIRVNCDDLSGLSRFTFLLTSYQLVSVKGPMALLN